MASRLLEDGKIPVHEHTAMITHSLHTLTAKHLTHRHRLHLSHTHCLQPTQAHSSSSIASRIWPPCSYTSANTRYDKPNHSSTAHPTPVPARLRHAAVITNEMRARVYAIGAMRPSAQCMTSMTRAFTPAQSMVQDLLQVYKGNQVATLPWCGAIGCGTARDAINAPTGACRLKSISRTRKMSLCVTSNYLGRV